MADGTGGLARKLLSMQRQTAETSSEQNGNPGGAEASLLSDPAWNDTTADVGVQLDITEAPSDWAEGVSAHELLQNESLWGEEEEEEGLGSPRHAKMTSDDTCWDESIVEGGVVLGHHSLNTGGWELGLVSTVTAADIPNR